MTKSIDLQMPIYLKREEKYISIESMIVTRIHDGEKKNDRMRDILSMRKEEREREEKLQDDDVSSSNKNIRLCFC